MYMYSRISVKILMFLKPVREILKPHGLGQDDHGCVSLTILFHSVCSGARESGHVKNV